FASASSRSRRTSGRSRSRKSGSSAHVARGACVSRPGRGDMTRPRWALTAAAALAAALSVRFSTAAADIPRRIHYAAPADCPTASDFFAQIHGRTERVRLASSDEPATICTVTIAADAGRNTGRLEIQSSGSNVVRRLDDEKCQELVSALALVT